MVFNAPYMYKFEVRNDETGVTTAYTMPENWHEVTTQQYIRLRTEYAGDTAHLLEILSGNPRSSWMAQDVKFVEDVLILVSWIGEKQIEFDKLKIPEQLEINGHQIKIPKDLGMETFGQKMLVDNKLRAFMEDQMNSKRPDVAKRFASIGLIDYIAAVYLCRWIVGKEKFDAGDVELALLHVRNTPAYLIYPIAGFFLKKSIDSIGIGKKLSRLERRKIQRTLNSARGPGPKG